MKNCFGNLAFEKLWARAVFELNNIANYLQFQRLIQSAYKKKINKKNFIVKMAKIEFMAVKKTQKFYKDIWRPWIVSKNFRACPGEWYIGTPLKFSDWIEQFDKNADFPWKIYAHFYENHLEKWALANK